MAVRTIIFRGKRIDNGEWVCGIAAMMDMSIEDITLKVKGDASRYKNNGEKKCVERED